MRQRPSHRDPRELQVETCELCGSLVPQAHLVVAEVEGLRGYAICDFHPFEARARLSPSYRDFQRVDPGPTVVSPSREQPTGGGLWFEPDPDA